MIEVAQLYPQKGLAKKSVRQVAGAARNFLARLRKRMNAIAEEDAPSDFPARAKRARRGRVHLTHSLVCRPRIARQHRHWPTRQPRAGRWRSHHQTTPDEAEGKGTHLRRERVATKRTFLTKPGANQAECHANTRFRIDRIIPLQIPEPVWREWKINGVDADHLAELQAEYGEAVGYEFDWGQIIEEVFDGILASDSDNLEAPSYLAVRWHFVLCDVYTAFLDGGGNLGELSDLATVILAEAEHSRHDLPEARREDALPAYISFDEGNNISALRSTQIAVSICGCAQPMLPATA